MGVVDSLEDINGSISILNTRTVNYKSDQQPDGICDDMALTAVYLFPCIVARNTTAFCCFNTLAVNNTRTWTQGNRMKVMSGEFAVRIDCSIRPFCA